MKQKESVLFYLKSHNGITALEAVRELGIIDLAGVIRNLKKDHYEIESVWQNGFNRYGDEIRFKRYFLVKKPLVNLLKEFLGCDNGD